jgi:hypothetical protein
VRGQRFHCRGDPAIGRHTSDGKAVNDVLTYKVSDRAYDNVLRHLGGLRPGETKPFRPWKD